MDKSVRIFIVISAISVLQGLSLLRCAVAEDEFPTDFKLSSRHIFDSDVEATSGEINVTQSELRLGHEFKVYEKLPVELSVHASHVDIDENVATELPSHLEGRGFGIGTKFPVPFVESENYFMGIEARPSWFSDDNDMNSDSFRIPMRAYLIYKESDDLILVGGVSIRPEFDDTVLRLIGFRYRPNDELSFNFLSDDPNISYKWSDKLTLLWEFDYVRDEYEVTRNGVKGLILKHRELSTGAGVQYALTDYINAAVSVGGVFSRRFEYEDDGGKVVPEGGLYTTIKVSANF